MGHLAAYVGHEACGTGWPHVLRDVSVATVTVVWHRPVDCGRHRSPRSFERDRLIVGRREARRLRLADAGLLADPFRDLDHDLRVLAQERLGVLPPLAELLAVVRVPGPRLLDDRE